jgi:hypothetical protein
MRFLIALLLPLLAAASASAASVELFPPRPNVLLIREPTATLFTARVQSEPGRHPAQVRLLRLQANGNLTEASAMWDNGTHADNTANDQIYTCKLEMKEPEEGIISYTAEALYPDTLLPVRSRATFIKIFGGLSAKEKKAMVKTVNRAGQMYARLEKERGLIPAQRETLAWLLKQEGVVSATLISKRDMYIQFLSGAGMILNGPPEKKETPKS